jgi:hypothetical protein
MDETPFKISMIARQSAKAERSVTKSHRRAF